MTRIDQFKKDKLKSCVIEIIVFLLLYILAKAAFAGSISMVLAIFLCFPPVIYCVFLEEKLEKYHEPSCRLRILTGAGAGLCAAAGLFSPPSEFSLEIMFMTAIVYFTAINIYQYKTYPARIAEREAACPETTEMPEKAEAPANGEVK
ncbi:MAG: hypothetical protein ACLSFO_02140 [Anaerovoracaceae bacterium]|nr:hypothetical protein [Bacillota bacterium]